MYFKKSNVANTTTLYDIPRKLLIIRGRNH